MKIRIVFVLAMALGALASCVIPLSNATGNAVVQISFSAPAEGRFLAAETHKFRVTVKPEKGDKFNRTFVSDAPIVVEVSPGTATIGIDVFDKESSLLTHGEVTQALVSGANAIDITLEPARVFESDKAYSLLARQVAYFQLNNDTDQAFGAEVGSSNDKAKFWPVNEDGTWDDAKGGTSGGVDVYPGDHMIIRVLQGDENGFVGAHFGPVGFGSGGGNHPSATVVVTPDILALSPPSMINRLDNMAMDLKFQLTPPVVIDSVYFDGQTDYNDAAYPPLFTNTAITFQNDGKGYWWVNFNVFNPAVKAGSHHISVIFADGTGQYWGFDRLIQIVDRQPLVLSAEGSQNAMVRTDGTLWTWATGSTATQVGSEETWQSVSLGGGHIAAMKHNNSVLTWGNNSFGQLSLEDLTDRSDPVTVGGLIPLIPYRGVAAGAWHTLFLDGGSGYILGAGAGVHKEIGTWGPNQTLAQVILAKSARLVRAGDGVSAAILNYGQAISAEDGTLLMWGSDADGQLGDGLSGGDQQVPTPVGTARYRDVSIGQRFTLGLQEDGTLWIWGYFRGSLLAPTQVLLPPDPKNPSNTWRDRSWASIGAGDDVVFAVKGDGELYGWGAGLTTDPTMLGTDRDWKKVAASGTHALLEKQDGSVWTWIAGALSPVKVMP